MPSRTRVCGTQVVVVVGVVFMSCGGTQGPQGPAGPPANRSSLYCLVNRAVLTPPSALTATITCEAATDIPWQGTCYAPTLPTGYFLAYDEPVGWDDVTAVPGWQCTWAAGDTAPPAQSFGGNAEICCFAIGHSP